MNVKILRYKESLEDNKKLYVHQYLLTQTHINVPINTHKLGTNTIRGLTLCFPTLRGPLYNTNQFAAYYDFFK